LHPLVVVVDGDRQDLLRVVLADDVVVEEVVDLDRLGQLVEAELARLGQLFLDDLHARAGDQLLHLLLGLAAERALEQLATVSELGHVGRSPFAC
jgi:hypothetical protein